MGRRLFVGNLPYSITEVELKDFFAARWTVIEARVVTDRDSGRSRGFGFVELDSEEAAAEAISGMDGEELGGRRLAVREAHERQGGRRPRRRSDERGEVEVDTVSRRGGGGFRGDGPPRGRRGDGGRRYAAPPEPSFDGPDPFGGPAFDDGGKSRRRERRKRKKRHEDNESDW